MRVQCVKCLGLFLDPQEIVWKHLLLQIYDRLFAILKSKKPLKIKSRFVSLVFKVISVKPDLDCCETISAL